MKTHTDPVAAFSPRLESCWIATLETVNAMVNDRVADCPIYTAIDAETAEVLMLWMVERAFKGVRAKDYLFDNDGRYITANTRN
mgnify:CR=1 FL=1